MIPLYGLSNFAFYKDRIKEMNRKHMLSYWGFRFKNTMLYKPLTIYTVNTELTLFKLQQNIYHNFDDIDTKAYDSILHHVNYCVDRFFTSLPNMNELISREI